MSQESCRGRHASPTLAVWGQLLLALSLCLGGPLPGGADVDVVPPPPYPVFQKGITFVHGYRGRNDLTSAAAGASLEHLRHDVHAEWIALNPFAYQHGVDSPDLHFGGDPPDEHLVRAIRHAHELGLKVMLKPHIWLRAQSETAWRGTIAMTSEAAWRTWFDNYEAFILHQARLAASEHVEIFCVGVELALTVKQREADWRRLIAHVRQVYPGPLTYAANWYGEYDEIGLWRDLDYIGINAFFPLSDVPDPTLDQLRAGAARVADQVEAIHLRTGKPVIFTEVGFKSTRGGAVRPWEWPRRHEPEVDLEAQARAYQAVFETLWDRPWFSGMYWWKWFADLQRGGPQDGGFTPRGKPAEQILADWYRRPAPVRIPAAPPAPVAEVGSPSATAPAGEGATPTGGAATSEPGVTPLGR